MAKQDFGPEFVRFLVSLTDKDILVWHELRFNK